MAFCSSCGKPLNEGSLFCSSCGMKQQANGMPSNQLNTQTENQGINPPIISQTPKYPTSKPRGKLFRLLFPVVLILFALVGGGTFYSLVYQPNQQAKAEKQQYQSDIASILTRSSSLDKDILNSWEGSFTRGEIQTQIKTFQGQDSTLKQDLLKIKVPAVYQSNFDLINKAFSERTSFLVYYNQAMTHQISAAVALSMYQKGYGISYLTESSSWISMWSDDNNKGNAAWNNYSTKIKTAAEELGIQITVPSITLD